MGNSISLCGSKWETYRYPESNFDLASIPIISFLLGRQIRSPILTWNFYYDRVSFAGSNSKHVFYNILYVNKYLHISHLIWFWPDTILISIHSVNFMSNELFSSFYSHRAGVYCIETPWSTKFITWRVWKYNIHLPNSHFAMNSAPCELIVSIFLL